MSGIKINFIKSVRDNSKITWDFIYPILACQNQLKLLGYEVRILDNNDADISKCDIPIVLSSIARYHKEDPDYVEHFVKLTAQHLYGAFFDIGDSAGVFYRDFIEQSRFYFKKQTYKDRSFYCANHHDSRTHLNHYISKYHLKEKGISSFKFSKESIERVKLSWNVGVGDYRTFSFAPEILDRYLMFFQFRLLRSSMSLPGLNSNYQFSSFENRTIDILSLFSDYKKINIPIYCHRKETIEAVAAIQDRAIFPNLKIQTGFLSQKAYRNLVKDSKAGICPFGWGEISWKDFEFFQKGVAVFKPDMCHIETWPNYYENNVTYVPYSWDASDLAAVIQHYFQDSPLKLKEIATAGQRRFKDFDVLLNPNSFTERFSKVINEILKK